MSFGSVLAAHVLGRSWLREMVSNWSTELAFWRYAGAVERVQPGLLPTPVAVHWLPAGYRA